MFYSVPHANHIEFFVPKIMPKKIPIYHIEFQLLFRMENAVFRYIYSPRRIKQFLRDTKEKTVSASYLKKILMPDRIEKTS